MDNVIKFKIPKTEEPPNKTERMIEPLREIASDLEAGELTAEGMFVCWRDIIKDEDGETYEIAFSHSDLSYTDMIAFLTIVKKSLIEMMGF